MELRLAAHPEKDAGVIAKAKATADENMRMPWADIQGPLVKFLETMVEAPENIRSEAREVADSYGRYNPEKFRDVWEKLSGVKNGTLRKMDSAPSQE